MTMTFPRAMPVLLIPSPLKQAKSVLEGESCYTDLIFLAFFPFRIICEYFDKDCNYFADREPPIHAV
jgi:hypothetical protein